MDRDVVNALHRLYQQGPVDWDALAGMLGCGPDSFPDVEALVEGDAPDARLGEAFVAVPARYPFEGPQPRF